MPDKLTTLFEWLKQPSTIKMLGSAAGLLGVYFDPTKFQEIILGIMAFIAIVNGFYDNTSRKPKIPTPDELNVILSSEAIVELVRLRKSRIEASKTLAAKV